MFSRSDAHNKLEYVIALTPEIGGDASLQHISPKKVRRPQQLGDKLARLGEAIENGGTGAAARRVLGPATSCGCLDAPMA